jgi:nucleotide-binding universal stress UspA family protein
MRILFATDGSKGGLEAARLITRLPLDTGSRVTVLTVLSPIEAAEAHGALAASHKALGPCTATIGVEFRCGNPVTEILDSAELHSPDLLVLGSHGLSGIARFFLGSVAERVARHARCPVLVVRGTQGSLNRVMVGVDGSNSSLRAVEYLHGFPLPAEVEVRLVTVLPSLQRVLQTWMAPPHAVEYAEAMALFERRQLDAQEELEALTAAFAAAGRNAMAVTREGDPAATLLQAAEEQDADLIVVGAHGLSATERFHLGSVSEKILRYTHCSVMVVR